MKRFFALAVVLSVCLSLVSCSGNDRASAESVVEGAIKAFQSADKQVRCLDSWMSFLLLLSRTATLQKIM